MPGQKGNSGGKPGRSGRKPKADSLELIGLLDKHWPRADREKAIKKHADQANQGNVKSLALLLSYTYGKPKESIEHGGGIVLRLIDETSDAGNSDN